MPKNNQTLFGRPIVYNKIEDVDTEKPIVLDRDGHKTPLGSIPLVISENDEGVFLIQVEPEYLKAHPDANKLLWDMLNRMKEDK